MSAGATRARKPRTRGHYLDLLVDALGGPGAWLMVVAGAFAGVAALAYHVVSGRLLGEDEYGAAGSLLGVAVLLQVATNAAQVALVAEVASGPSGRSTRRLQRRVDLVAAGLAAGSTAVSPLLQRALHLDSVWPVIWLGLALAAAARSLVARGVLLGEGRFAGAAASIAAGAAVRLGATALLASMHPQASSALAAAFLGELTTAALASAAVRTYRSRSSVHTGVLDAPNLRDLLMTALALTGVYFLTSLDTLLSRSLLTGPASGRYVAASTLASIALFLPSTIAAPAFRGIAAQVRRLGPGRQAVFRPLVLVALTAAASATGLILVGPELIRLTYGKDFSGAYPVLTLLGPSYACLATANVLVLYEITARRVYALLGVPAVGLLAVLVALRHADEVQVAQAALVSSALLLGVLAGLLGTGRSAKA